MNPAQLSLLGALPQWCILLLPSFSFETQEQCIFHLVLLGHSCASNSISICFSPALPAQPLYSKSPRNARTEDAQLLLTSQTTTLCTSKHGFVTVSHPRYLQAVQQNHWPKSQPGIGKWFCYGDFTSIIAASWIFLQKFLAYSWISFYMNTATFFCSFFLSSFLPYYQFVFC